MKRGLGGSIGSLQLALLDELWRRGAGTVHSLQTRLESRTDLAMGQHAYVTLLTVLRRLEMRGLVRHTTVERSFLYQAVLTREELQRAELERLVPCVFPTRGELVTAATNWQVDHLLAGVKVPDVHVDAAQPIDMGGRVRTRTPGSAATCGPCDGEEEEEGSLAK
jgi:predicted transcriptional regulator